MTESTPDLASEPTAPHNPCATCGACCRSYVVPVCGYDIWLISTRQRLGPEQFVVTYPQEVGSIDGFMLDEESPPYGLALDKQGKFTPQKSCVFLVHLADGHDRCGIYEHRPITCHEYPMTLWRNTVYLRKDVLCPPGSWPMSEVKKPSWEAALRRFHMHFDIYREVVVRWNSRLMFAPAGTRFRLPDYFNYLMNVYDRLALLDNELGERVIKNVQSVWPTLPRPSLGVEEVEVRIGELPWLDYLSRARQVIDTFYPEVPPQPMIVLEPTQWPDAFGVPESALPDEAIGLESWKVSKTV